MWNIIEFLTVWSMIVLGARAHDGFIYAIDPDQQYKIPYAETIDQNTAKLILERRMTSAQSSLLRSVHEDTLESLNQFGGRPVILFGHAVDNERPQKMLVIFDGLDSAAMSSIAEMQPHGFYVPHVSAEFVSNDFLESVLGRKGNPSTNYETCQFNLNGLYPGHMTANLIEARKCLVQDSIFQGALQILDSDWYSHFSSINVETWTTHKAVGVLQLGFETRDSLADSSFVKKLIHYLLEDLSISGSQEINVLLLPSSPPPQQLRRLSVRSRWKEDRSSKASGVVSSSEVVVASVPPLRDPNPLTLISFCHASNSSCMDATSNCSGHGHCYRKYASAGEAVNSDCYACKCVETTVSDPDGTVKRLRWGGPACQKIDVSAPFFILVGVTVLLLAASVAGIKLLFSVGQEELPSVIAAGIGVTKAQK